MTALTDPVLAQVPDGLVRRCPCCADFEVRFGGAGVTLTAGQLRQMQATLVAVCAEAARPGACRGWTLRVRTPRQRVVFALSRADAEALGTLLGAAVAALDLDALLLDLLGPRPFPSA